jgi:hypothetical protein
MAGTKNVRAEIEEQRCLIEEQQVEILRHRHQIEMQRRYMAHLEAELEAVKTTFGRSLLTLPSAQPTPSNGNGHRAGPPLSPNPGASR